MDFITGLPLSHEFTTIMVVVDRLTKFAHFSTLPTYFTATKIAIVFTDMDVKHHGFPHIIIWTVAKFFLAISRSSLSLVVPH